MSENVVDNSIMKSFNFKTINEVYEYKKLTVTQQSNYFIKFISYNFRLTKISTNDSKLYYYNDKDKLWSDTHIQLLSLLDNNPDFLPINNGKKINLKTLEITDRT